MLEKRLSSVRVPMPLWVDSYKEVAPMEDIQLNRKQRVIRRPHMARIQIRLLPLVMDSHKLLASAAISLPLQDILQRRRLELPR